MNIRRWVKLALLFSAAVVLGITIPVTLSYVFDVTNPLVNTFVPRPVSMMKTRWKSW